MDKQLIEPSESLAGNSDSFSQRYANDPGFVKFCHQLVLRLDDPTLIGLLPITGRETHTDAASSRGGGSASSSKEDRERRRREENLQRSSKLREAMAVQLGRLEEQIQKLEASNKQLREEVLKCLDLDQKAAPIFSALLLLPAISIPTRTPKNNTRKPRSSAPPPEERAQRAERRKENNRISASNSRHNSKMYLSNLRKTIGSFEAQNQELQTTLASYQQQSRLQTSHQSYAGSNTAAFFRDLAGETDGVRMIPPLDREIGAIQPGFLKTC